MTYLIDTDYVVDYLKDQRDAPMLLDRLLLEGLALSTVTFAEVYEGIYYGDNRLHYEQGLRHFLRGARLLNITQPIARQFALIRGQLRTQPQGKTLLHPKDNYDLFIAATALHYKLTLITRNIQDYAYIPHLKLYQTS